MVGEVEDDPRLRVGKDPKGWASPTPLDGVSGKEGGNRVYLSREDDGGQRTTGT